MYRIIMVLVSVALLQGCSAHIEGRIVQPRREVCTSPVWPYRAVWCDQIVYEPPPPVYYQQPRVVYMQRVPVFEWHWSARGDRRRDHRPPPHERERYDHGHHHDR